MNSLQIGSTDPSVSELQKLLGIPETGTFDTATDAAVRAYQAAHSLFADGVVGPMTWASLTGAPPPVTAPPVPTVPHLALDPSTIAAAISAILPLVAGFYPPIAPFIPLIQGILNSVKDIHSADPTAIGSLLLKHLPDIFNVLQQHKAALSIAKQ